MLTQHFPFPHGSDAARSGVRGRVSASPHGDIDMYPSYNTNSHLYVLSYHFKRSTPRPFQGPVGASLYLDVRNQIQYTRSVLQP